ncbi:MBL fold metallo-hydrolase [Candidatus Gracilibacteria bacterium]|nr:MBL fold metallo-hydrolase [Candidatus Gracilibacteria bacterium]
MRLFKTICIVVVACGVAIYYYLSSLPPGFDHRLHVDFLNIGQGDSTLIQTRSGERILIDGGMGTAVIRELQEVMPQGERAIDLVIATHGDKDHIEGLQAVINRYTVKTLYASALKGNTLGVGLLKKARARGTQIIFADEHSDVRFQDGSTLDILYPFQKQITAENANDYSIVARYDSGEQSFLFTGDLPSHIEELLIARRAPLDVDVLKVGHHGSKFSTSKDFLTHVTPELATISVGKKNTYGHPDPGVLARLKQAGSKIMRTDLAGRISLTY